MKLRIAEKEAPKTIKIVGGDGGVPMDFAFWLQLKEVAPYDTRMRLVLHIDLNMMMRMMIGSKIQGAIDQIAEALAKSFNAARRASEEGRRAGTGGAKALTDGRAPLFARKAVRHTATGETESAGRPTPPGKRHGPHRPTLPILFSDGGILKSRRNTLYL